MAIILNSNLTWETIPGFGGLTSEQIRSAFWGRAAQKVLLRHGFPMYKMHNYATLAPNNSADTEVSPWWASYNPYEEDPGFDQCTDSKDLSCDGDRERPDQASAANVILLFKQRFDPAPGGFGRGTVNTAAIGIHYERPSLSRPYVEVTIDYFNRTGEGRGIGNDPQVRTSRRRARSISR